MRHLLTSVLFFALILTSTSKAIAQIEIPASGNIVTFAGNGTEGYADATPATNGELASGALAVDGNGNVFFIDASQRVREVVASTGALITIAGNGTAGYSGDGGPATSAEIYHPQALGVDAAGNIFIGDSSSRIRKVSATTGIISTVIGNGTKGYSGDGGPSTNAEITIASSIAVDPSGDVFFIDSSNYRVREISASNGIVTTVVGNGNPGNSPDGTAATNAEIEASEIGMDSKGNIFLSELGLNVIREVSAQTGTITTIAGTGTRGYSGDGGPATQAELAGVSYITADHFGNVIFLDTFNYRIRQINLNTGTISTVIGNGSQTPNSNVPTTSDGLDFPGGVAVDAAGDYISATLIRSR